MSPKSDCPGRRPRSRPRLPNYQTVDGSVYDLDGFTKVPGFPNWLFGRLRPTPALVYMALFWFEWMDAQPKVDTIAPMIGVSPRTVRRAIRELEDGGYIRVTPAFDEVGVRLPNRYEKGVKA